MNHLGRLGISPKTALLVLGVCVLAFIAYGVYVYTDIRSQHVIVLGEKNAVSEELALAQEENERLTLELSDKLYIIESFESQIESISSVVGNLQKLSQTDKELLRKYSKVYFLNENYVPARLAEVDEDYILNKSTEVQVHADVLPHLERLFEAARRDDIDLLVSSAFRSFSTQATLKAGYKVMYGSGTANQFSADQGYSEHQLGTTVDFATTASGPASNRFETDPAYKWLLDNAHEYGFVLSYPKGNAYYIFEPWHWRFVGRELARDLKSSGKYFYDMDQRELDTYLIKLFD